jgi:hypothetical protein
MRMFSRKKKTESEIYDKNVKIPDYVPKDASEDGSENSGNMSDDIEQFNTERKMVEDKRQKRKRPTPVKVDDDSESMHEGGAAPSFKDS